MSNSTAKPRPVKPSKPRIDFPLFPHANGRWAKKVRQRLVYFGKWQDDPLGEKALELWNEQKDDLLAGRKPRKPGEEGISIADLCNQFLTSKTRLVENDELTPRSFRDYKVTCDNIVATFGKHRPVSYLRPPRLRKVQSEFGQAVRPRQSRQ